MSIMIGETSNAKDGAFVFYGFKAPEKHALAGLAGAVGRLRGVDTIFDDSVLELAARPPLSDEQLTALAEAGRIEVEPIEVEASQLALHMRTPQPHLELIAGGGQAPEPEPLAA